MNIEVIFKTARCVTIEIKDGSIFESEQVKKIFVDGVFYKETKKVITSIYGLKPDQDYQISVEYGMEKAEDDCTRQIHEFVTLNVRDFGAKGDGIQDDTNFIQAAILCCPPDSRVLIPEGTYKINSLFLKDDLRLELAKGAVLSAMTDRTKFPILKGLIESYDEQDEYNLGTWEGNPLDMFSGIITGIGVKNVILYGEGVIEGNASYDEDNWWFDAKRKRIAFRPQNDLFESL